MKDLGKTKFCLGLQIEHLKDGIHVHQSTYTKKILNKFYMDKAQAHPLSTSMVVRLLDVNKDQFRPYENDEEFLGSEVPYLSTIGALMYLANNTRLDVAFAENMPTILYEDNATCIAQLKGGYIKGDRTKHISPKLFFTHDLEKKDDIEVQQICSSDNLADLFTKKLPTSTFKRLRNKIGMRQLKDIM
ncbi:hypothetical protein J1N35_010180 [Gossypium stocksii]|uniref:Reverse transcriptase Ty1/copia-type domain-containing protein n=1 Tax=Gossypium stocksii TaxID=47602 RepID=A0A9D3W0M7_9ROSI|nr:hypothetical protein J1N35_010180 [Gossypium stocksii]